MRSSGGVEDSLSGRVRVGRRAVAGRGQRVQLLVALRMRPRGRCRGGVRTGDEGVAMSELEDLLLGVVDAPQDEARYLVLADWLEEYDDPRRADLLRLHRR